MDVRIGISQSMKEIEVEMPEDTDREELAARIEEVVGRSAEGADGRADGNEGGAGGSKPSSGSRSAKKADGRVLWLTDRKGRLVGVPASKIAYVEIGAPTAERRVGFGAT